MSQIDFMITKSVSGLKLKSRIMLCISVLMVVLLLAMVDMRENLPIILILLVLAALLLVLNKIFALILKIANVRNIRSHRDAGAIDSPVESAFYPDRMTITGASTHSVFRWEDITNAYETAGGLFIVYRQFNYFYIPARFFDRDTVARVTDFLQEVLGDRFIREALMNVSVSAEDPGEAMKPSDDEGQPAFRFDFAMTGSDIKAIIGRGSRISLSIIGAITLAICGIWAYASIINGNNYYAAMAILVGVIVIVVFISTYIKRIGGLNYPTSDISLRWYEDHVTAVTYQEDQATNIVYYTKIKQIRRQGSYTIVKFNDNTFLYVPESSFSDEGEKAEFESFLKEKQLKYSKL